MNKLTNWIKQHQIAAFFIVTFAITWGLGFSYGAVIKRDQFLLAPLVMVATCGPALAGIIISGISNSQPRQGTRKAFWIAFLVSWLGSVLVFIAHNTFIYHAPPSQILIDFSIVLVVPVAFVISAAYSRNPAIKSFVSSLIRLRDVWGWSFLALVLVPGLALLSIPFSSAIGRPHISTSQIQGTELTLVGLIAIKFFYQLFFFNATGEEVGWRGFALPRLQAFTSPLFAALIISFFWAPWHFFLWQAEGAPVLNLQFWIVRYTSLIPFSVLIVWICNRAKGSILVAGIAHAAANTGMVFIPVQNMQDVNMIVLVAALVMIVADKMWKKLRFDHPAVYQERIIGQEMIKKQ